MMGQFFQAFDIELGDFYNMPVQDDWCAIRYNVFITNMRWSPCSVLLQR